MAASSRTNCSALLQLTESDEVRKLQLGSLGTAPWALMCTRARPGGRDAQAVETGAGFCAVRRRRHESFRQWIGQRSTESRSHSKRQHRTCVSPVSGPLAKWTQRARSSAARMTRRRRSSGSASPKSRHPRARPPGSPRLRSPLKRRSHRMIRRPTCGNAQSCRRLKEPLNHCEFGTPMISGNPTVERRCQPRRSVLTSALH